MKYIIKVKDFDGNFIGEFDKFRKLEFGKRLNNYATCQFEIPLDDPKATSLVSLRRYSVWVYRVDNGNTDLVWSGEQSMRDSTLKANSDNWCSILCYDWIEVLKYMVVGDQNGGYSDYIGYDAGEIAWLLIENAQQIGEFQSGEGTALDYGIRMGTIDLTVNRDRNYYDITVYDAITNLTNVIGGFDYEITNNKIFNVYERKGINRSLDVRFEYGKNITDIRITEDFTNPANYVFAMGMDNDGVRYREEWQNMTSLNLYKQRQTNIFIPDVTDGQTLIEKAKAMVNKYSYPLIEIDFNLVKNVSPNITDFALGDIVKLVIKSGIYNIDEMYRVNEWQIKYDNEDSEKMKLLLAKFVLPEIS